MQIIERPAINQKENKRVDRNSGNWAEILLYVY